MGQAGHFRFGIHSGQQYTDFPSYLELWRCAEELGLDWVSVFDHFLPIQADPTGSCFEGLTLLAAMAAHTTRVRCGVLVVGNTYRNPALLANIATTIDHISGGRLELGIGAAWYELEHRQYGFSFPSGGRRIRMLGETARILKRLWTEPSVTFEGRYYQLHGARCEPKPLQRPHPPLWVGGAGEQLTLRVAAESGDGWNTFLADEDVYRHKLAALAEHCAEVGRDPAEIRKSLVFQAILGETPSEAKQNLRQRAERVGMDPDALRQHAIVATPEQCAQRRLPATRPPARRHPYHGIARGSRRQRRACGLARPRRAVVGSAGTTGQRCRLSCMASRIAESDRPDRVEDVLWTCQHLGVGVASPRASRRISPCSTPRAGAPDVFVNGVEVGEGSSLAGTYLRRVRRSGSDTDTVDVGGASWGGTGSARHPLAC